MGSSLRTPRTGSKGTPVRVRSDIQADRRLRTVHLPNSQADGIPMSQGNGNKVPGAFFIFFFLNIFRD